MAWIVAAFAVNAAAAYAVSVAEEAGFLGRRKFIRISVLLASGFRTATGSEQAASKVDYSPNPHHR
jgi:hypothetical protein